MRSVLTVQMSTLLLPHFPLAGGEQKLLWSMVRTRRPRVIPTDWGVVFQGLGCR